MKHPYPLIGIAAVAVLLLIGIIVWVSVEPNAGCSPGQQLRLVSEVPTMVGKVVVMIPIYACEA